MDDKYLLAATRYVGLNPVKAGLVPVPEEYQWSSAKAHLDGKGDSPVTVKPLLGLVGNWRRFLRFLPVPEPSKKVLVRS
jgi:putative transposase